MDDRATPLPPEPSPTDQDDPEREVAVTWRLPSHRIRFCKLESCQPDGGRELAQVLEERLGVKVDEHAYDGSISLEALECIGLCDIRQAATIDDAPYLSLRRVVRAVDELLDEG